MASDYTDIALLLPSIYSAVPQRWYIWPCISDLTFSFPISPSFTSYRGMRRSSLHWVKGQAPVFRDRYPPSDIGFSQASRSVSVTPTDKWTLDLMGRSGQGHTLSLRGQHFSCQPTNSDKWNLSPFWKNFMKENAIIIFNCTSSLKPVCQWYNGNVYLVLEASLEGKWNVQSCREIGTNKCPNVHEEELLGIQFWCWRVL